MFLSKNYPYKNKNLGQLSLACLTTLGSEKILILSQMLILCIEEIDIFIIDTDIYNAACKLIKTQIPIVSMRNREYQAEKRAKSKIHLKRFILKEY